MKTLIPTLLVIFLTSALAFDDDQILFDKITGIWLFEASNGDMYIKATENYKSDGTIDTHGKIYIKGELVEEYKVKSKWNVMDGYSHVEVLESNNDYLKPGLKITDKIISVNDKEFTFESDDGKQTTIIRIK